MKIRALVAGAIVGAVLTFGGGVANAEANSPYNFGQCQRSGSLVTGAVPGQMHPATRDASDANVLFQVPKVANGENRTNWACSKEQGLLGDPTTTFA